MYNLVKPFNYDATKNRIKPQMQKFLKENLTADVPKPTELADRCAVDLTDYIEIMVECHGQESRGASSELYGATSTLGAFCTAGILKDDWFDTWNHLARKILFDELRRCGIRKCDGYFAYDGKDD